MVVYEVKDIGILSRSKTPKPIPRGIAPTAAVSESKAIHHLLNRRHPEEERKKQRRGGVELSPAEVRDVKRLANHINLQLEKSGSGIHFVLIQEGDGFVIDVYDCSRGDVCEVIHDMTVGVDELQGFLVKLQQESGIIFDKTF